MLTTQLLYDEEEGWTRLSGEDILEPSLVLVFGTGSYFFENSYNDLRERFPKSEIIGCSTAGTIAGQRVDDMTVATLIYLEKGSVKIASKDFESAKQSISIGEELANELNQKDLQHIFVLSEGLNINGSCLANGFNNILPEHILVTGGLAGDGVDFLKTYVIANDQAKSNRVTAVGFYGDTIKVDTGCFAGWDDFGAERLITKAEGNILYEMDGKPALELYKSYLADQAANLPASGLKFPISIRENKSDKPLIRTLLAIDEEAQSLTFAGNVTEGYHCRLMKSNIDKLIDNAGLAAESAKLDNSNSICLAVSCVGRRIVLSQLTEEEIEVIEEVLGTNCTLSGFYSYGELAPLEDSTRCELHNQTMTLTVISEDL